MREVKEVLLFVIIININEILRYSGSYFLSLKLELVYSIITEY